MTDPYKRVLFFVLLLLALTPWASPPAALACGIFLALAFGNPYHNETKAAIKPLLQTSVVGLGFGMNLEQVLKAGASGLTLTAGGIAATMLAGLLLGRWLKVKPTTSFLISTGTAICGGSAIAAVGPIIEADSEEMSVSLATVFILNSAALLLFPIIGALLGLTESQFGLWAALGVHDTSSVVGATVKYGPTALAVGTTVKLARALWIVPLALATAAFRRSEAKTEWPWFILFFLAAAGANSYLPAGAALFEVLNSFAKAGLQAALFLIGSGLSLSAIMKVGPRPLAQGLILWLLAAAGSLALAMAG